MGSNNKASPLTQIDRMLKDLGAMDPSEAVRYLEADSAAAASRCLSGSTSTKAALSAGTKAFVGSLPFGSLLTESVAARKELGDKERQYQLSRALFSILLALRQDSLDLADAAWDAQRLTARHADRIKNLEAALAVPTDRHPAAKEIRAAGAGSVGRHVVLEAGARDETIVATGDGPGERIEVHDGAVGEFIHSKGGRGKTIIHSGKGNGLEIVVGEGGGTGLSIVVDPPPFRYSCSGCGRDVTELVGRRTGTFEITCPGCGARNRGTQ